MAQPARRDDGFSLVEMLIVLVVLGILAAIVMFGIATVRRDATGTACRTDYRSIEYSVAAVFARTGAYPADQTALVAGNIPRNGALLKTYPASPLYRLVYTTQTAGGGNGGGNGNGNGGGNNGGGNGNGGSAGGGAAVTGYTITVQRPDGSVVGTSRDACDSL